MQLVGLGMLFAWQVCANVAGLRTCVRLGAPLGSCKFGAGRPAVLDPVCGSERSRRALCIVSRRTGLFSLAMACEWVVARHALRMEGAAGILHHA